jgi:TonB-dependent SusC/RagA subfamily outer membrane receptor
MPGTSSLDAVNAKDVQRIEILKNAAAAIYGVRGGNGVIVISTQRVP